MRSKTLEMEVQLNGVVVVTVDGVSFCAISPRHDLSELVKELFDA